MKHTPETPPLGDVDVEEFRRRGREIVDWIARYLADVREYPVLSKARPGDLLGALPLEGPEHPRAWDAVMNELDEVVLPGITHWNHPRFFAYFANTGSVPGILGAALAAALNPNAMLWRTSPAATELEQRVLAWLAAWLGLPEGSFGIINDTASTSSLCALAAARQTIPEYRRATGNASVAGPLRLYLSEQAHSSIDKAAILMGIGHESLRRIAVGPDYSMHVGALERAILEDRASGYVPFCVVATAGTTSTTSVDPLAAVAEVCAAQRLWLHVDAAYGGALALVPEKRSLFQGWERADSIVVNPHKWLFTPMSCSLLFTRRPDALREAFSLVPEYLRSDVGDDRAGASSGAEDGPVDFMNYGIQLGRPFRALKLWMVINEYGRSGIVARLREHLDYSRRLVELVDAHPDFERLAPTPMSTLCFRYCPGAGVTGNGTSLETIAIDPWGEINERLLGAVNATGTTFLSHTRLRGRVALRLAIGNARTGWDDVALAWSTLQRIASELTPR